MTKLIITAVVASLIAFVTYQIYGPSGFAPDLVRSKRVLITGASTGIGEQLAYQYAKHGARLFITSLQGDLLEKVRERCLSIGAEEVYFLPLNMAREEERERLIKEASSILGGLDHVVLNHAAFGTYDTWEGTAENMTSLTDIMTINFIAYAHLASLAMPHLTLSNGNIGAVSSVAGKMPNGYVLPYVSSKHALQGFFESLRIELRLKRSPVSVTTIVFGGIATEAALKIAESAHMDLMLFNPPDEAARMIMEGVSTRTREVTYPKYMNIILFLHTMFPETVETLLQWNVLPDRRVQ